MASEGFATGERSIWSGALRPVTIGSIIAVTIVAFQGLALATIAPVLADDIGGRDLYGWIFSAFLIPQIVGTVVGGLEVDRRSPAIVFGVFLLLFGLGCVVAGLAPDIIVFFIGRALQGFGAGGMFATVYAVIALAYHDSLRAAMMAAVSTAWIVPSLIGPAIAGFIAEQVSWRLVFFLLLPVLAVVAPLTLPVYHRLHARRAAAPPAEGARQRLVLAVGLAIGTAVFLLGLELRPWPVGAAVATVGLVALIAMLRRLMPPGIFTARPVLSAAIAVRSLTFGGFLIVETYMVFALKEFGGVSASIAGLILTFGSLTWSGGSLLQARWEARAGIAARPLRMLVGVSCLLVGTGGVFAQVAIGQDIWLGWATAGWVLAGLGMGLAIPTSSTVALAHATAGAEGQVVSSTLLGDLFTAAIGVGLGGVLLAFGLGADWSAPAATTLAMSLGVVLLIVALLAALRLYRAGRTVAA